MAASISLPRIHEIMGCTLPAASPELLEHLAQSVVDSTGADVGEVAQAIAKAVGAPPD